MFLESCLTDLNQVKSLLRSHSNCKVQYINKEILRIETIDKMKIIGIKFNLNCTARNSRCTVHYFHSRREAMRQMSCHIDKGNVTTVKRMQPWTWKERNRAGNSGMQLQKRHMICPVWLHPDIIERMTSVVQIPYFVCIISPLFRSRLTVAWTNRQSYNNE